MIKLKDYLGSLISSVNQARVLADIESANIAQAYANDDILKNFPIPRFRAKDVEINIPVAIEGFDEQTPKDYQPIDNRNFNSRAYFSLKDVAKVSSFSRNTSTILNKLIAESTRKLETELKSDIEKSKAFESFSKEMGDIFFKAVELDKISISDIRETKIKLQNILKAQLFESIKPKRSSLKLENAYVMVKASNLREIPNENIVHIKMKLFEDGMEWHTSEDNNGEIKSKLLPE